MNIFISIMLGAILVLLWIIGEMVAGIKDKIDLIRSDVRDIYSRVNDATYEIKGLNNMFKTVGEDLSLIYTDTSLLIKRFNNIAEEHKKKEQEELEKKNDHVKRVVERVKSVLYPYAPNMWQYVYEERKDRNRHKFTITCGTTEDIITSVRNTFYNSGVEWSERRDQWEREWTIYIYDAE